VSLRVGGRGCRGLIRLRILPHAKR